MTGAIKAILTKLGLLHPFQDSDVEEAMSENLQHEASKLAQITDRATEAAELSVASISALRQKIAESNLGSFADFERLVHHGERRHARRH